MDKIYSLIIGGTGQFGITLSKKLNKKNKKIIITSRSRHAKSHNKVAKVVTLNIYNKKKIKNAIY